MMRKYIVALALTAGTLTLGASYRSAVLTIPQQNAAPVSAAENISGTYSFLREGEFVQLTVEDGRLSGYVSRFGDSDSDKGQFIDQFFDKTTLDGDHLTFNTKTVHGVWYDFKGTVTTTPSKKSSEEGFHVMKGTLVQHTSDDKGVDKAMQRQVEFKSFPADQ